MRVRGVLAGGLIASTLSTAWAVGSENPKGSADVPVSSSTQREEQVHHGSAKDSTGQRQELDVVVVTATKRREELQDVPMSVAVIGSEDIERRGLIGMEDYLRSVPGVNEIDLGGSSSTVLIRGIATDPVAENYGSGPTVSTYFDETPFTGTGGLFGGASDIRPVDMERIEVLRGPQGTAFGDASLGGTLRLIPMKPDLDALTAKIAADYSNTSSHGGDNTMIQGILNVPVMTGKLGLRAVGYRYDQSGYYRNVAGIDAETLAQFGSWGIPNEVSGFVQDDVGKMVTTGGRISALFRPVDNFSVAASYVKQKIEEDGSPVENASGYGRLAQTSYPIVPAARVRGQKLASTSSDVDISNVVLNYNSRWGQLTSALSYVTSSPEMSQDFRNLFGIPASQLTTSDFKATTAELRLASMFSGRFQYLVGTFYQRLHSDAESTAYAGEPPPNPFLTNPFGHQVLLRQIDQRSLFSELSYDISNQLTATVGGRYFKYRRDESFSNAGGIFGIPLETPDIIPSASDENGSVLKAQAKYKPTASSLLYASWSQGFRLGRPSTGLYGYSSICDKNGDGTVDGTNLSIASTTRIDSDTLDNYEVGGKFDLLNRRMSIEAAAYHIRWNKLPVLTSVVCSDGNPYLYTANVGAATSDGADFHASLIVVDGLKVDVGAGYTKAELSKDAPDLGAKKGDRLPGSQRLGFNFGAQYDFMIGANKAFVRADSFYTGSYYGDLQETAATRAGDYIKVDVRAGLLYRNLSMELYVKNLTNEDAATWATPDIGGQSYYRLRPRTAGVQLSYGFDDSHAQY